MKPLLAALLLLVITSQTLAEEAKPKVVIQTSMGDITLELDSDKAPKTVANFLQYVDDGYYDGTIFHRVMSNFMIQGGGLTPDMVKKETRAPITNEADNGLRNKLFTIAMARTGEPHSATSQFFINVKNNSSLDHREKFSSRSWGYAVFGRVVDGIDVVGAIKSVKTEVRSGRANVPLETVMIKKVSRINSTAEQTGEKK